MYRLVFFSGLLLCSLVAINVHADDKPNAPDAKLGFDAERFNSVLETPEDLNTFFGDIFGKISLTMPTNPDLVETMLNQLDEAIKDAKPENAESKAWLTRATSASHSFRSRLELARVSIDDLTKSLKENAHDTKTIKLYGSKASEILNALARDKPKEAKAKLDEMNQFLSGLSSDDADDKTTKAIEAAKRGLQRLEATIASSLKLLELIGKDMTELQVAAWANGSPLTDGDLKGKVVLLDFWAVWCGPCIATFPHLIEWQEEYGDKDFVMIGLTGYYKSYDFDQEAGKLSRASEPMSPEQELKMIERFAEHHGLKHRLALQSSDSTMSKDYGVRGIPHVVVIDKQGKIRMLKVGSGPANAKAIGELLEELLNE